MITEKHARAHAQKEEIYEVYRSGMAILIDLSWDIKISVYLIAIVFALF